MHTYICLRKTRSDPCRGTRFERPPTRSPQIQFLAFFGGAAGRVQPGLAVKYARRPSATTTTAVVVVVRGCYSRVGLLRGTIVNRTYGVHKKLHIYLFLLTIFGPIYYGPP